MPTCAATGIAYDRAGPIGGGATVVLVHAGIADRGMWDPQWARLTARHDMVRVDLRGFGESTAKPTAPWSPAGDVIDTLRALGIERAHLVGCSYGAGVAVEVALVQPDLVASLLLCAPGGSLIEERTDELAAFIAAENAAMERDDLSAAVEANLAWWVDGPQGRPDRVPAALREAVAAMQRRAFEVTADWDDVEDLEVELDPPLGERYGEVTAPTLVLSGDLDVDAVTDAVQRLTVGVAHARSVVWSGAAHLPSMERPEQFAATLEEWLG